MPKARAITQLAKAAGKSETELLTEVLEAHGSVEGAAKALNVYPNSINHALRLHGLRFTRQVIGHVEKVNGDA